MVRWLCSALELVVCQELSLIVTVSWDPRMQPSTPQLWPPEPWVAATKTGSLNKKQGTRCENQGTRCENRVPDVKTGTPDCVKSPLGEITGIVEHDRGRVRRWQSLGKEKMMPSGFSKAEGEYKDMAPTIWRVKMTPTEKKKRLKQNKNKLY